MISPSGPLQKAIRTGVSRGVLGMLRLLGSIVISAPAVRARSRAASVSFVRRAKWMIEPSGLGSSDPLANISR